MEEVLDARMNGYLCTSLKSEVKCAKILIHLLFVLAPKIRLLPVSQSQDKQLQKGRVYEQVLIVTLKLREPGKPVSPASRGLHRDSEQPVEELYVLRI